MWNPDWKVCLARPISLPRTLNFSRGSSHEIFVKQQKDRIDLLFSDTNTAVQAICTKENLPHILQTFQSGVKPPWRLLHCQNLIFCIFLLFRRPKIDNFQRFVSRSGDESAVRASFSSCLTKEVLSWWKWALSQIHPGKVRVFGHTVKTTEWAGHDTYWYWSKRPTQSQQEGACAPATGRGWPGLSK